MLRNTKIRSVLETSLRLLARPSPRSFKTWNIVKAPAISTGSQQIYMPEYEMTDPEVVATRIVSKMPMMRALASPTQPIRSVSSSKSETKTTLPFTYKAVPVMNSFGSTKERNVIRSLQELEDQMQILVDTNSSSTWWLEVEVNNEIQAKIESAIIVPKRKRPNILLGVGGGAHYEIDCFDKNSDVGKLFAKLEKAYPDRHVSYNDMDRAWYAVVTLSKRNPVLPEEAKSVKVLPNLRRTAEMDQAFAEGVRAVRNFAREAKLSEKKDASIRPKLLLNSAQCLTCKDILVSKTQHDFQTCSCKSVSIDGGLEYARVLGDSKNIKDLCLSKEKSEGKTLRALNKESKEPKKSTPTPVVSQKVESRRVTKLRGAVLDFSGTIFDQFNKVTLDSFQKMFARLGIIVHMHDILPGIGLRKSDHIWKIMQIPHVAEQIVKLLGEVPRPALAEILGQVSYVESLSKEIHKAKVIDGAKSAIESMQLDHHLQIGITTGFPRSIVDQVIRICSRTLDMDSLKVVASDDPGIIAGRPQPYMLYQSMSILHFWKGFVSLPMNADIVKIGDTPEDIAEGRNARAWTVAIAQDSALNPFVLEQFSRPWEQVTPLERYRLTHEAAQELGRHNPDYVVTSISDVPKVIQNINYRLECNELPNSLKDARNQKTNWTWIC